MATIVLLIISVGAFGYLAFGEDVDEIVLKSLSKTCGSSEACKWYVHVLNLGYVLAVMVSWPLIIVPPVRITEKWFFAKERPRPPAVTAHLFIGNWYVMMTGFAAARHRCGGETLGPEVAEEPLPRGSRAPMPGGHEPSVELGVTTIASS